MRPRCYVPGSGLLHYRYDGGEYQSVALVSLGGELFQGTLPRRRAVRWRSTTSARPATRAGRCIFRKKRRTRFSARPWRSTTSLFAEDFEAEQGWTVWNDAGLASGAWQRATPAGDDQPGAPVADYDGSGMCFVTDNRSGDVDGGPTQLTSPVIDLSGWDKPYVRYARWMYCDDIMPPAQDFLDVEFSADGGATWTAVEHVSAFGRLGHAGRPECATSCRRRRSSG